jgi:flagellar hook-basal body complex protein FliE
MPVSRADAPRAAEGARQQDFARFLVDSLNEVSNLQQEADLGVERLMTGQTDNVAEVMSSVRKAEVAFSMLMEIRNKLLEAYSEVRQMQV